MSAIDDELRESWDKLKAVARREHLDALEEMDRIRNAKPAAPATVAEVLANRKPDEAPVNLKYKFNYETFDADCELIDRAQKKYEIDQLVKAMKAEATT